MPTNANPNLGTLDTHFYDPLTASSNIAEQAGAVSTGSDGTKYAPAVVTVSNANANGQNTMQNSQPVVLPSDQSPIPTKKNSATIYTTTQTGISATGNSGDQPVGQYTEMLVMVNLTAITGTSINFRIRAKDAFGNYYTLNSTGVQSAAGAFAFSVGAGAGNSITFGDTIILEWLCVAITSATFTATIKAK